LGRGSSFLVSNSFAASQAFCHLGSDARGLYRSVAIVGNFAWMLAATALMRLAVQKTLVRVFTTLCAHFQVQRDVPASTGRSTKASPKVPT
jgi:hypothetical protein